MRTPDHLDPRNPAFEYMGPTICRRTVCFIAPDGYLFWVPMITLQVFFKRFLQDKDYADWLQKLETKEKRL